MKCKGVIQDDFTIQLDKKTVAKLKKISIPNMEIIVRIGLDNGRSLPQHRRYFGILNSMVASFPESTLKLFYSNLIDDFTAFGQIDTMMVHDLLKRLYGINSIGFAKLTQSEANDYFNWAVEKLKILGRE